MHNLTRKQLNILLLILSTIAVLIVLVCGITLHKNGEAPLDSGSFSEFEDSWVLVDDIHGDSAISLPYDTGRASGELVTITHRVPEKIDDNSVLYFRTEFQAVEVKINDIIVYSYGVDEKRPFGKAPVPVYHMVGIGEEYSGGNISITFESGYDKYSGEIPVISYGNRGDILYSIWRENAFIFIMSILLVIFSIAAAIIWIFMGRHRNSNPAFLYLIIFLGNVSVWSLSDNLLIQFFVDNMYLIWLIKAISILIIPIVYLMYIRCFTDKKKVIKLLDYGLWIYVANFIMAMVAQFMGLVDYVEYMKVTVVLITIGLAMVTLILSTAIITFGKKSLRDNVWANIVFLVFMVADFIFGLFDGTNSIHGVVLRIGIFVYALSLLVVTERHMLLRAEKKQQTEVELIKNQKQLALNSLNPNFIFATLNIVLGLIKEGSDQAQVVLYNLSRFLRFKFNALNNTQEELVDFENELEHIKVYLSIEAIRHKELTISIEDKVVEFQVPVHSIEPLVENAIKHGLSKRNYEGTVIIRSYERKESYAIQIIDNGVGFDIETIKKDTFTSIKNIRSRIYDIDGDIEIASKKGKGTIITITIPKVVVE